MAKPVKSEHDATTTVEQPRVVYLRDDAIGLCDFSLHVPQHAMKPFRTSVTHALVDALGLSARMLVIKPPVLSLSQLQQVHTADYLHGLADTNQRTWEHFPLTYEGLAELTVPFTPDCPMLEGILDYSRGVASGSLLGAELLCDGTADIAIHWAGGMHHAHPSECSGFCYINDINLAIVRLTRKFDRVLYIDLDVHHGDGVEEAFYFSDRVFTLSLHRFGESFFPGTGHMSDIGVGRGRYYALNVPLQDGIGDLDYVDLFSFTLQLVVERFKPQAVVLQCGADSLAGDRVGVFNLSSVGHGRCIDLVRRLGLPLLAVGGGGYTTRNVAKLWAYETSILCGVPLPPSTRIFPRGEDEKVVAPAADPVAEPSSAAPEAVEGPAKVTRSGRRRKDMDVDPAALLPQQPAPKQPTAEIDDFQRAALRYGVTTSCCGCNNGGDGGGEVPREVLEAVAQGVMDPIRCTFFADDILYVAPEEAMLPRCNMSAVLSKLRRLVLVHMRHVTANGCKPEPIDPLKAEPAA